MNATLRVDVVCDTQQELEELIAEHGYQNLVVVEDWSPDGPAGGNAEATLYGEHTAVTELALLLGYEEDIIEDYIQLIDDDEDVSYTLPNIQ